MKPFPEILATIENTRQDVTDCEAVAARLRYGLERPDLEVVKEPVLLMFTAARQAITASMLLLGSVSSEPSSELFSRVERELSGAMARVSSLATLWQLMEGEGQ